MPDVMPLVVGEGPLALTFDHADEAEQQCSGFVPGTDDPCLNAPVLTVTGQDQTWHFCQYHSHILGVFAQEGPLGPRE